jgi:hypothetical protein
MRLWFFKKERKVEKSYMQEPEVLVKKKWSDEQYEVGEKEDCKQHLCLLLMLFEDRNFIHLMKIAEKFVESVFEGVLVVRKKKKIRNN